MKTLYLDLVGGISGDMFLAALVDLGVPVQTLTSNLQKLPLDHWTLEVERPIVHGIPCTKINVKVLTHDPDPQGQHPHHTEHRSFTEIKNMLESSTLDPSVKSNAIGVFKILAEAEAHVHKISIDEVHFHEVGAIDSIIDIVGVCIGLSTLGWPKIFASPPIDGCGIINAIHGSLPVPVPAVLEICKRHNIPIQQCNEPTELITPTGAALLAAFCSGFCPMPHIQIGAIGYGAGSRRTFTRPNYLRAILGTLVAPAAGSEWDTDTIAVLETNLDDVSPEILGHFMHRAMSMGALDVFYTPIMMKKNRPGVKLTVLCGEQVASKLAELIVRETGSFGVRQYVAHRRKLHRENFTVTTPYGQVQVKLGRLGEELIHLAPEFESCATLANQLGIPLKEVYNSALKAASELLRSKSS